MRIIRWWIKINKLRLCLMTSRRFFKVIKGLFIQKCSSDNTLWCKQNFHGVVLRFSSVDSRATTSSSGICVAHYSRSHQSRFYFLAFKFLRIFMWLVELFFFHKIAIQVYFSEIISTCKYCFLHLSLSRKILCVQISLTFCYSSQNYQMHLKKVFFWDKLEIFFFFFVLSLLLAWIISRMTIFIIICFVIVSDRFKNYSVKRYLCFVIPVWGLSNDLHVI